MGEILELASAFISRMISGRMHPKCTRIIPVSKWLVIPIYKTFRPFGRGITLLRGLTITMVINHILTWMILQVVVSRAA